MPMTVPVAQPEFSISDTRRYLIANGYRPVPVLGKFPRIDKWQQLEPNLDDVERLIHDYPDHVSTGLLTGELVAIDADILDEQVSREMQALVSSLPGASHALCRIGKAPKCMFLFRAASVSKKKATPFYVIDGIDTRVEVMGKGQQIVAFGIHPETKRPYEWIGDSPIDVTFAELPEISTEAIDQFLVEAEAILAAHGIKKEAERKQSTADARPIQSSAMAGDGIWSVLKSKAMENLDTWVPQLGLARLKRYQEGYLSVASFRPSRRAGLPDEKRHLALEISPNGICDHSDGNRGYNPIDLVVACKGGTPSQAADWLRGFLGDERDTGSYDISGLLKGKTESVSSEPASTKTTPNEPAKNLPNQPQAANDNRPTWPGVISSGQLVEGFVPPDYQIDGIIQAGFLYSLTAPTGTGKTAVLLKLTAMTAIGTPLGEREIRKGRVVYFAGENPSDVTMRWIAEAHHTGFDASTIDVHFIPGTFDIVGLYQEVSAAIDRIGGVDMVIVDTSAAYFNGTDENANAEMAKHARALRTLTTLPGGPCVLVACHPTKNASNDALTPRGGGAFLAEVDGNLTLAKDGDTTVKMHHQGKFRGPPFDAILFGLSTVTAPTLLDSKGREIPTVMATPMSAAESRSMKAAARRDEDDILLLMERDGKLSLKDMADELCWRDDRGEPHKRRAVTASTKLKETKLAVYKERVGWSITQDGHAALVEIKAQRFREESSARMVAKMMGK